MTDIYEANGSGQSLGKEVAEVMIATYAQRDTLTKEVEKYCKERNVGVN
jgi:indoleamine 2,3-dioxygenase